MNRKIQMQINKCKSKNSDNFTPVLEELITTHLTEELMDQFRISENKREKLKEFTAEVARQTKMKDYKTKLPPCQRPVPSQEISHKLLRDFAQLSTCAGMSRRLEQAIIQTVQAKGLEEVHPKIIESGIAEAKQQFLEITHLAGVNLKTKVIDLSESPCKITPYKYMGKTKRYKTFLAFRKELELKYRMHLPMFAAINTRCGALPRYLFNLAQFRDNPLDLKELDRALLGCVTQASHLLDKLYRDVVVIFKADTTVLSPTNFEQFLKAVSTFLSVQLGKIIARTLRYVISVTRNEKEVPYLKLSITFKENLYLQPTASDVSIIYTAFIRRLVDLGRKFPLLEDCLEEGYGDGEVKYIPLTITDEYLEEVINEVEANVQKHFVPIADYVGLLESEFGDVYADISPIESEISINNTSLFESGFKQIDHYQTYINKASSLMSSEYFAIGQLILSDYVQALKDSLSTAINDIVVSLSQQHIEINEGICRIFEEVKEKTMQKPKDSEEMIEQGNYMVYVKGNLLPDLQEKIQEMLKNLTKLIYFGSISEEHMKLNARTVNWIAEINEIIETSSTMFEQLKFEAMELMNATEENMKKTLNELVPKMKILDDMDDIDRVREYLLEISPFMGLISRLKYTIEWINKEKLLLGYKLIPYQLYEDLQNHLYPFYHLLAVCRSINRFVDVCLDGPFEFLNAEEAETFTDESAKELINIQKKYRMKIRQSRTQGDPVFFEGVVDDLDTMMWPSPLKLTNQALTKLKNFRPCVVMMNIMCNDALMKRHWKDMSDIAGFDLTPNSGTTIRKFMAMGLEPDIDKYDMISSGAIKERDLYRNLQKMLGEWKDIFFKLGKFKETGITILTSLDDIQVVLDDHILKALTMRGSIFVKPYETEVRAFYDRLVRINKTLDEWGKVQAQWLYLLPIFSSKDIVAQMPEEGQLFKEINDIFLRYMNMTQKDPRVYEVAGGEGILETMIYSNEILDQINNGVTNYLEKKRLYFPRFFFLSNDEMLEILSETKDPLRVQPHLKKCFEAIDKLQFDDQLQVSAMFSQQKEKIAFKAIINTKEASGSVEKWLVQVEEQMIVSVRDQMVKAFKNYVQLPRTQWLLKWPGQIIIAAGQMHWTLGVHKALNREEGWTIESYRTFLRNQLNDIVNLIRDQSLTNLNRISVKAMIVIEVHDKDVVEELYMANVKNDKEFKWLSQLRYYLENEDGVVRLVNTFAKYACEYLGNTDRLVITPLTDRCYRTLMGALHLNLNGAPEGPAGTGKTETVKDLAKAIAIYCVVFNCSDGLDYKAMGKFFKGIASCGAWTCFDEFNRIDIEVLSVVAQQILTITLAIRAHAKTFLFEGTELVLKPCCYVCITMNPGYAGRTELPDNLKVLFRTVAMMVPDYALIGEIFLYSYGFMDSRKLSVKIVTTYRLCSEQLSSQNHYDYGMRSVISVLLAAGNNKRKEPDENEDILLLRAILDVNLPKFLNHDLPLFDGIISDLFPGVVMKRADYQTFLDTMKYVSLKAKLIPKEGFMTKIIQTYEMMIVRHGFMVVGPPYAGKTSTLKTLADGLGLLAKKGENEVKVQYKIMNPKAVTLGQLYGQFDPVSYDWNDGVIATVFRSFSMDTCTDRKWMILDGPVDAVWIENMNTVLDANKKLCLMSGEVIAMSPGMSLIFEVMDLEQASPATVSRCGMIYMEPSNLGWEPFIQSWLPTLNPQWAAGRTDMIMKYFQWLVPPCMDFIRKHCLQYCQPGFINQVINMRTLFNMYMEDAYFNCDQNEDLKHLTSWVQVSIMQACNWGLGCLLDSASRLKFDDFHKELWRGENEEYPFPESLEMPVVTIPPEGIFVDYSFIYKGKGFWKFWPDIVKSEKVDEAKNILQTLIPTIDTFKYMSLVDMHIRYNKQIILMGPTGTGKTFYTEDLLMNRLDQEKYEPGFITFTVQITCNQTQDLIISKLFKRRRGHYGAPKGKVSVIFIDDVNMPVKEIYGAQPPLELLRQYFDHKNWYDLKNTSPIYLHDVMFIGAMGLVGGSRQEIYPRFLRHFNIFSINEFTQDTMAKIYTNLLHLGWKNNGFPNEIIQTCNTVVTASLELYAAAIENLRPTPSKSHYVFNLRDFSRLVQGCSMLKKDSVENKSVFPRLWTHEVLRVFNDRLVEDKDRDWLYEEIKDVLKRHFRENADFLFDDLRIEESVVDRLCLDRLYFGSYFDQENEDNRIYEPVVDLEQFRDLASGFLQDFNSMSKSKMDVILFDYALQHLSRICRVLTMNSGSILLVGISGSGRQSLTKLACFMYNYTFFQPEITNNYTLTDWRDDIKKMLKEAGGRGKHSIFLITESQIKEEVFLQDVDGLLNSGEVPNMYQIDEKQELMDMVRLAAQGGNRNLEVTPLTVFNFFTKRCKDKLHIILAFSPVGINFRTRLRLYPTLVNCCTINWFQDWPEGALKEVAIAWMTDVNLSKEIIGNCVIACKYFHVQARINSQLFYESTNRKTYMTSASYLELIKSFSVLTNTKQEEIMASKMRYVGGLEKLMHAATQISKMQEELAELQPKLTVMNAKATEMLQKIETETISVEKYSALVKADERVANVQAAAAHALKQECEADLAEAMPILNEAISALDTLKPADITLVKSMKNPPETVKLVLAAVCILKGIKPDRVPEPGTGKMVLDYWGPSKKMLSDMGFLQSLKDYDKENIKLDIIQKIRKEYIPHKDFKPSIVAKASSAAEGICKWIIAIDMYEKVNRVVAPKKQKLAEAEAEFGATMALLNEKRMEVQKLEAALAELNEKLADAVAKKQALQDQVDLCNSKLVRAKQMISGLGGEKDRWTSVANALQLQFDGLAGDVLISCGIISYLAAFNAIYRQRIIADWHEYVKNLGIPTAEVFELSKALGDEVKMQNWYINGLPRDNFSTENGIIQDISRRWSLLIDPQSQANQWIKKLEKVNQLVVVKFSHKDYMKKIENCISAGVPVLVEGIEEELEAPLDPVLYKTIFKQGGMTFISMGENIIEYNLHFRLYLTSKFRNPHFLPEVFNRVTIINFALTIEGLQDQLLGIVVAVEKPELQQLKEELILQKAENRAALINVEAKILKTLAESKGDILEDEVAIRILDESKILSIEIKEKQTKSLEIENTIEEFRVKYQSVSEYSAVLYYCISDLANVDPMYQYSLEWFINLYVSSIQRAEKFRTIERRCISLINAFTFDLYSNITRSLFEKDKLLFSFLLCCKIMISQGKLDEKELLFLLTGGVPVENKETNPTTWLPKDCFDELCRVGTTIEAFADFLNSFKRNHNEWKAIYDNFSEELVYPNPWNDLTNFRKLILVRIFRPDKLISSIIRFVILEMDDRFIKPPPFDIAVSYNDSYSLCPLIFILSPGTDPMSALVKFAEEKQFTSKFQSISLGQGQGPIAEGMIRAGQDEGLWVCLQNCHLATSWMPTLEKIFENLDYSNTNDNFRLWLTSYPSNKFPISLLQKSVKMTNEPPTGLQNNLLKSYISEPVKNSEFYSGCPDHEDMFARMLYGLAFFHAVVQERRTFGPLGWNIPYGFNDSDFDISVQQLQMFINESDDPFEALAYLIGECNYGGRVTDDWDRRLIVTILADYLNPELAVDNTYKFNKIADYYGLPDKLDHRSFIAFIKNLPPLHPPEVFGLHSNAGITRDLKDSFMLLNSVLKAYGEVKGGFAGETDKLLMNILLDILNKLPEPFDTEVALKKYPLQYSECMNTVLIQEMERFNRLLRTIRDTCINMQRAIEGLVAMNPILEDFAQSLLLARIPVLWNPVSYPSLKNLPNYMTDFLNRIEFLDKWYREGKPSSFWLSGFFFTQAFLTGMKQNYARKYTIPIDQLTYDFEILKKTKLDKPPEDGAYIYGLFIDGARWNRETWVLDELLPKILQDIVPPIWVIPLLMNEYKTKGRYVAPVYKTSERKGTLSTTGHSTNYVLPILMETKKHPSHWIKRSVALLCQLN